MMCISSAECGYAAATKRLCRGDVACTPQMQRKAISATEVPSCLKQDAPLLCSLLCAVVKCVLSPGKVALTTVRVSRVMLACPFECANFALLFCFHCFLTTLKLARHLKVRDN